MAKKVFLPICILLHSWEGNCNIGGRILMMSTFFLLTNTLFFRRIALSNPQEGYTILSLLDCYVFGSRHANKQVLNKYSLHATGVTKFSQYLQRDTWHFSVVEFPLPIPSNTVSELSVPLNCIALQNL